MVDAAVLSAEVSVVQAAVLLICYFSTVQPFLHTNLERLSTDNGTSNQRNLIMPAVCFNSNDLFY